MELISFNHIESVDVFLNNYSELKYKLCRIKYLNKIESIWEDAKNTTTKNFINLKIFNLDKIEWISKNQIKIYGFFIDYKDFYAQKKNQKIKLNINPLGVSGIIKTYDYEKCVNKILFGKRSSKLTQYPSYYEMVPSGFIENKYLNKKKVYYKENLINEFEEELDLSISMIKDIKVVGLVYDKKDLVYDIMMIINTFSTLDINLDKINNEYSEFIYVPTNEIHIFFNSNKIVPTSLSILNLL